MSTFSGSVRGAARVATATMLAVLAMPGLMWGGEQLRLSIGGGGRSADGLIVDYKMGEALPGVVTGNVISNLGNVPFNALAQSSGWLSVSPVSGTTPAVISITVNPSGLGVGTYTGSIIVTTTVQVNGKILDASDTSPVTLRISPATASTVTVAPTTLAFDGTVGQALAAQSVKVSSTPASVNFAVASSQAWLSVNPASGITNGTTGQSVSVFVDTAGLTAGDYSGALTISTPGATPATQTVAVTLKLRAVINVLSMAPPASLTFTGVVGGPVPAGQSFGLEAGAKNLNFTVTTNAAWLSVTPANGRTPGVLTVQVNPAGMTDGTYQGVVETTVPDATPTVYQTAVTFKLDKAPAPVPLPLTVTPTSLSFAGTVGGLNPPAALLSVADAASNSGVAVTVAVDVPWLKVTPVSGATPFSVDVQALSAGLTSGQRTGKVTLTRTDVTPNLVTTVPVTLSMSDGPVINLSPSSVSLQGRAGESTGPGVQANLVLTTTSAVPVFYDLTLTSAGGWLKVSAGALSGSVSAAAPVNVSIMGDAKMLASGSYDGSVGLKIVGQSTGAVSVPVTFLVDPALPALDAAPKQLSFSGLAGGVAAAAQAVNLTTNPGTLAWTANVAAGWLKVTPMSGNGSQALQVTADPGALAPGKYTDTVVITGGAGQQTQVAVTFEVQPASAPTFGIDPTSLTFTKMEGSAGAPGQQTAALTGISAETAANTQIQWGAAASTTSGGNWLSANLVNAGVLPLTLNVYADSTGLVAGVYDGTVTVTATAATVKTVQLAVRLTVTAQQILSYVLNPVSVWTSRTEGSTQKEPVDVSTVPAQPGLLYTAAVTGGSWLTLDAAGSGLMPDTLKVSMDPTGLTPGVYKGKLTVTATSNVAGNLTNPIQATDLVLTVTAIPPPSVKVSSVGNGGLVFDLDHPNDNPGTVGLANLRNEGGGTVTVRVASDTPWLTFASTALSVGNDIAGVPLIGVLNRAAVPGKSGSYVAGYTLSIDGVGQIYNGMVTLLVKSSAPSIELAPTGSTLTLGEGYSPASALVGFMVRNTGTATQNIVVTPGALLTPGQGGSVTLQPGENVILLFSVNGGLTPGVYTSIVRVVASTKGGSLESTFNLGIQVLARPPLSVTGGGYKSTTPGGWAQVQVVLTNPRTDPVPYFVSVGPLPGVMALTGASADPASGSVAPGSQVTVTVAGQTGATLGLYGQTIAVNFGGEPFLVPMVVGALPGPALESKSRSAAACDGGTLLTLFLNMQDGTIVKAGLPTAIQILAVDTCGNLVTKGSVTAAPSNGDDVIVFLPGASAGTWVGTWTPVNTASPQVDLAVASWDSVTTLRSSAKVRLALQQVAAIPAVVTVVNPADYGTEGATAAGGWIAITGKNLAAAKVEADVKPYPVELGGTKVLLGDRALPLMMVSPNEVYAFVPYDVATGSVLPVQVVRGQVGSTPQAVAVNVQMPALFLKDPKGESREGRVVASRGDLWFDASLANPVMAGDILYMDSISLGPVDQDVSPDKVAPEDPLARVKATVTVTIGGMAADVWYAGLIPGTVGVYQIRIGVPAGVAPANDVPIVVTIDGQSSTAITVALR